MSPKNRHSALSKLPKSEKLANRASDRFKGLKSNDMNRYLGITEWPYQDPVQSGKCQSYIQELVDRAMVENLDIHPVFTGNDRNRARYVSATKLVRTKDIYRELLPAQHVLTTYFWHSLENIACAGGDPQAAQSPATPDVTPAIRNEVWNAVRKLESEWAYPEIEVSIQDTNPMILSLEDDEFRFLLMWAGGLDRGDGAGHATADDNLGAPGAGTVTVSEEEESSYTATSPKTADGDHEITQLTTAAAKLALAVTPNPVSDTSRADGLDDDSETQKPSATNEGEDA